MMSKRQKRREALWYLAGILLIMVSLSIPAITWFLLK